MSDWLLCETMKYERRMRRRARWDKIKRAGYPTLAVALGIAVVLRLKGWL